MSRSATRCHFGPLFQEPCTSPSPCESLAYTLAIRGSTGILARGEIWLYRIERLFEGFLMRDLARHQEAEGFAHIRIISEIDQPLVD